MTAALAAAVAAVALAAGGGSTDARLSADQLVGQRLVVGFAGTEVPDSVRSLVAAGDLAGVVLFSTNFSTPDEAASLVADLRSVPLPPEAREPLLVMVDPEGGEVKRLPGPPDLSAAQMGAAGPASCARQGDVTGAMLVESLGNEVLQERREQAFRSFAALISEKARGFYGADAVAEVDAELTSVALVGGLAELVIRWLDGSLAVSRDRLVDHCAKLFVASAQITSRR